MLTTTNPSRAGRVWRTGAALAAAGLLAACTPPGPRALLDGDRLLREGRPTDAIRRLRTAVEFLPNDAQAWNHLGLAYHAARQPAEAAEAYQQAVRLNRNLTVGYFNLGCLLLEQGDFPRAADTLRTHVGLDPQSVEGWKRLSQAHLRLRQWDLAERSLITAQRLAPDDPEILNATGVVQQQRRRYREAWQTFNTVVSRRPDFAPAWLNLAVAAHQAGAKAQAAQAYRRYASLRPDQALTLGLPSTIASLESPPPAPVVVAPIAPAPALLPLTSTNPANLPASTPSPKVTTPPSSTPSGARSSPATDAPAQTPTRTSPSRRASTEDAGPRESGTHATNAAPIVAQSSSPAPPPVLPLPRVASPIVVRIPPDSPSKSVTTASPSPISTPSLAAGVAQTSAPSNSISAPLEVVEVTSETSIATAVRDEPAAAAGTPSAPGAANANPPALVRPVSDRRATRSTAAEKRGFWDRANPAKWFSPDDEGGKSPATSTAAAPSTPAPGTNTAATDASRWRWANPGAWFRDDPAAAQAGATPGARPLPPPVRVAAAPRPAPADTASATTTTTAESSAAPREFKRYEYLRPTSPVAGDRAAAQPILDQALSEHRGGRYARAVELYEEALKQDPGFAEAHQNLAAAALLEGDLPRALKAGETALTLRPESPTARLNFSLALDRAGYAKDAADEAERLVAARPDDAAAHLLLGNLYAQRLNDPGRARVHYQRLIELQPDHPQSAAIRRWLAGPPR